MTTYTTFINHSGGGTWPVHVHDHEDSVPAGTVNWLTGNWRNKGSYATPGAVLGYLKRYAANNGHAGSVWHVYPETSVNPDLPVRWTLNVGTDYAVLDAALAAKGGK
jgi:hypothetical protein